MAGHDGRQSGSLIEQLYRDASRFTFLQAVRLIERIELRKRTRRRQAAGEAGHHEDELLFFRHNVRLDVPPSDVESLDDSQPPAMTTNVMGLAGILGPLPHTITELILEELRHGRRVFADFLDIFNHRLLSLLYRAKKRYRPALDSNGPHRGRVARVLYAILGLGTPELRGRVLDRASADRQLLAYAGLFAERYRSPVALERIIEHCFGVPATVVPFVGAWEELGENSWTAIGAREGRNHRLGHSALAGRRIWNQAATFEVRLGPLDFTQFRSFLPRAADGYRQLRELVRFYAHDELGFHFRLVLRKEEIPQLLLTTRDDPVFLGQTTWLHRRMPDAHDDQVRLPGAR